MSREDAHFRLRLPHDLREWLKHQVEKYGGSMTGEIIRAIREKVERESAVRPQK